MMMVFKFSLLMVLISALALPGQCLITSAEIHREGRVRSFVVHFDTLTPYRARLARESQDSEWISRTATNQREGWVWVSSRNGMDCVVEEVAKWTGCRDERIQLKLIK